jgi:cysteine synthase A
MTSDHLASSVVDAIGATPLVALDRLTHGLSGRIVAKLELLNPGFSIKDRFARQVIEDALRDGQLKPGQTVVELTSGNAGTGLAIVCAVKGHPFVAVMSKGNSAERARMMRALGAEVVLVEQAPGAQSGQVSGADLALVEEEAVRITRERGAFRADQFVRDANIRGHQLHTGPEIWAQSGGTVTAFCSFAGSGGTFAGVTSALKAKRASIKCYVVEPEGARVLAGMRPTNTSHRIQGGGYAMAHLPLLANTPPDGFVGVTDDEAVDAARRLAREEGIFAGFSAGANIAAALKLLRGPEEAGVVATVVPDSGLKYLSTDLWP